jgi:hypothetical protein
MEPGLHGTGLGSRVGGDASFIATHEGWLYLAVLVNGVERLNLVFTRVVRRCHILSKLAETVIWF